MNGEIRRAKIENILKSSAVPVPGVTLAKDLDVSRQIIVSDIALRRANGLTILSTNKGYIIPKQSATEMQRKKQFSPQNSLSTLPLRLRLQ